MPYGGPRGIRALLDGMQHLLGWEPIMEGENIIGLADVTGGGAISLEPGGQFELSGAPVETVHQTASELMAHLAQLREVAEPLGIGFLGLGMTPNWSRADMPMMPKGRYKIMTAYMPKVGRLRPRHDVPHLHGADEPRLLLRSRHGEEAARVAGAAAGRRPRCSPTRRSPKASRTASSRSAREIWRDTDNQRAGMLPWAFEAGMGFERYVDYALDVPMYFIKRGDRYIDVSGKSFRDLCAGKLDGCPASAPRISDWANHVSTIFPEVRLKRYIEMRGADGGPWRRLPALPAFWVGLLYDDACLDACWDMVKDWTAEERQKLRDEVPQRGFRADDPRHAACSTLAQETLRLAAQRTAAPQVARPQRPRRDALSAAAPGDRRARHHAGRGIAGKVFHGPWNGSVEPIFDEYAY